MKLAVLKKDRRFNSRNDTNYGIQTFGEFNDYPQEVMEVVSASSTGKTCVDVYYKFILGKGFLDDRLYGLIVNRFGQTADYLLDLVAKDYALFGGFCIHINFNANGQAVELQHIPFENCRFEKQNEKGTFTRIAVHPDWGRRFQALRRFDKKDIAFIDLFTPNDTSFTQDLSSFSKYAGQAYYYSSAGSRAYPVPSYDPALTDMNTEEGISNVSNRNVRNNFLAAGMLIDYNNTDESEDEEDSTEKDLLEYQGDENACKILYVQVKSPEEEPKFVPFKGTNYSSEFSTTEKSVQTNIGKAFNQPPILRAENVSANFGADVMKNAYNFYNSVTTHERLTLERVFAELFGLWHVPVVADFRIDPLSYDTELTFADRIGHDGMTTLLAILESDKLDRNAKRQAIRTLFNPTAEELDGLMPATI